MFAIENKVNDFFVSLIPIPINFFPLYSGRSCVRRTVGTANIKSAYSAAQPILIWLSS